MHGFIALESNARGCCCGTDRANPLRIGDQQILATAGAGRTLAFGEHGIGRDCCAIHWRHLVGVIYIGAGEGKGDIRRFINCEFPREIDRIDVETLVQGTDREALACDWQSLEAAAFVMESMLRRWCVSVIVLGLFVVSLVVSGVDAAAVTSEEVFVIRVEQGRLQQHVACDDPFSLLCGEENGSYKGEVDLKILPKGDPHAEKEPLCTVNCFRADPVCGSDGVTYWCGEAEAKCAEVEVAHEGYCDIWNGGVKANLGLHAAQSLQLVHMVWLVLAGLLIVIGLP